MSYRRIDIPTLNKEDKKAYIELAHRFAWCDHNISFKYLKEMGILLTSHPGNRAYLKASVESHKKTKLWITLAYDNYFDPERKDITWDSIMPSREVIDQVNAFILSPYQKWGGVAFPYVFLLDLGLNSLRRFKYIYSANGDCVIEKPENMPIMLDMLKRHDADLLANGWWDGDRPIFNSTGFIGRTEAIQAMMNHFVLNFIPLKKYEKTCLEYGNVEGRMGRAIKDLGLKVVPVDNPKNEQMHEKGYGTWYDVLGFRHLHAEEGWAYRMWKEGKPFQIPEKKYFDEQYLSGGDLEFINKYSS